MTTRRLFLIQVALLAMFVQGCWAGEAVEAQQSENNIDKVKSVSDSVSKKSHDTEGNAVFIEGIKKGGGDYSPIFYELKWSKSDSGLVCKDLLGVVNHDLKFSPYVDYADTKHFLPWELIEGVEDAGEMKYYKRKEWVKTYRPPLARQTVDIDNDGKVEYLYLETFLDPLPKQSIYIFKHQPESKLKIVEKPMEQSSLFWAFVKAEMETGNAIGEGIWIRRQVRLEELPEYSDRNRQFFSGQIASFFIYKHDQRNYLVADTLRYNPNSKRWYDNNPWLLLFSVSQEGQLNKTCILKRAH